MDWIEFYFLFIKFPQKRHISMLEVKFFFSLVEVVHFFVIYVLNQVDRHDITNTKVQKIAD
jgi:hypothetical protein